MTVAEPWLPYCSVNMLDLNECTSSDSCSLGVSGNVGSLRPPREWTAQWDPGSPIRAHAAGAEPQGRPMGGGGGPGPCLQTWGTLRRAQLVYLLSFLEFLCSQVPRAACQSGSPRAGLREASAVEAATPWPGLTVLGPWSRWPSSREGGPHRGYPAHTLPWN